MTLDLCNPLTRPPSPKLRRATSPYGRGEATPCRLARPSLQHCVGVPPDRGVDELVVAHRLLVGLDRADLLHQRGHRLDLVLRQTVILGGPEVDLEDRKSTRLNSSHMSIS